LHDLKSDIISEQENLSLKAKEQVNLKFKSEGNKIQFRFNEEIAADLAKLFPLSLICLMALFSAWRILFSSSELSAISFCSYSRTVTQPPAEVSAMRISLLRDFSLSPYSRYSAPARSETRPNPNSNYVRSSTPQPLFRIGFARRGPCPWDVCFHCKSMGHWRKNCPLLNRAPILYVFFQVTFNTFKATMKFAVFKVINLFRKNLKFGNIVLITAKEITINKILIINQQ
jgi:hypothetical protein